MQITLVWCFLCVCVFVGFYIFFWILKWWANGSVRSLQDGVEQQIFSLKKQDLGRRRWGFSDAKRESLKFVGRWERQKEIACFHHVLLIQIPPEDCELWLIVNVVGALWWEAAHGCGKAFSLLVTNLRCPSCSQEFVYFRLWLHTLLLGNTIWSMRHHKEHLWGRET